MDEVAPDIEAISDQIDTVNFRLVGSSLDGYLDKMKSLFETFSLVKDREDLVRVILGNGEDRCYLVMAQNTAEIRASGGFPGAAGFITVKDGILEVGEMSSIVNFVAYGNPVPTGTTDHENVLFGDLYVWQDRDACYNPHFPKVASISTISCENFTDTEIDGVISMTPHIVQEMLKITGETVVLEDGTEINGDNALQVVDRDLYLKYEGLREKASKNAKYLDSLFSDAAKKTMKSFATRFQLTDADKYVDMFEQGFKDRTIMIWMVDPEEEEIVTKAGASGKLNFDPEKPEIGVFFGCDDAARLGMFIRIDVEVGDGTSIENFTKEYPVTVTLTNYLNEVDLGNADNLTYLAGHYEGAISSFVHLFAPAGGTISDIQLSNGCEMTMDEYEGLQVGYIYPMMIYPDEPVTITYKVTTAPNVDVKPTYVHTPTLQDY
ncbi:MAG: DUF4012 domain-containing protein [Lachnospiraceae bacterium]|nr:DUF4012 domain-containing protein [Lachnospiraceae bacterium]